MATGKSDRASKSETLKVLEKCRKERDDAVCRERVLRDKLRQCESKLRSVETLKQKLKTLTADNKELRKQVKGLRTEIGLDRSPKYHGKTTKDVVNDLLEKERECDVLIEKAARLGLTVDQLTSELANAVTCKALLEEQVTSLHRNLKDMTYNQRRLLKQWEDRRLQREQRVLPALALKAVQTDVSIGASQKLPVNAFETETGDAKTALESPSFSTYHNDKSLVCDENKEIYN
ncbi:uncharacterized protein zgc:113691 [Syngnathoides biaculeatus]|uniref:uncharacterized protein zgc:113691 n=1 Tax=Syngnathoides biaculeatus TaxID=300417 RepID=UPI002ADE939B|nr:uncharacterized protein zgc:113691 [Syngnathoides biaculeatus]